MNRIRALCAAVACFVLFNPCNAQQYTHEFSLHGGLGFSGLLYSPAQGNLKGGFGGQIGAGYSYFFSPAWGVHTGVEFAFYNRTAHPGNVMDSVLLIYNNVGGLRDMYFKYDYTNYQEKQRAVYLQIPIMVQFQHPAFNSHQWYAMAGVKLGFDVSSSFKGKADLLTTTGYVPSLKEVLTNVPNRAFADYQNQKTSGSLDFGFNTSIALEGGIKWHIAEHWRVYTGLYFDFGLSNIAPKHEDMPLVVYNQTFSTATLSYNSLLTSTRQIDGSVFNKNIHTFAAGINVRITFGHNFKKKQKAVQVQEDYPLKEEVERIDLRPKTEEKGIEEEMAALREAKARQEIETIRQSEEEAALLEDFTINNYKCGVTNLSESQEEILNKKVALLLKYPHIKITVEGHTCDIGSDEVNMRYGQKRADELKAYLVSKGLEADRITAVSYGESRPIVPNTNEENRRLNRRVVVIIIKP